MVADSNYSVDSAKAFLLGSTYWITSQYLTIFTTHEQIPLAAADFCSIVSTLKSGLDM